MVTTSFNLLCHIKNLYMWLGWFWFICNYSAMSNVNIKIRVLSVISWPKIVILRSVSNARWRFFHWLLCSFVNENVVNDRITYQLDISECNNVEARVEGRHFRTRQGFVAASPRQGVCFNYLNKALNFLVIISIAVKCHVPTGDIYYLKSIRT